MKTRYSYMKNVHSIHDLFKRGDYWITEGIIYNRNQYFTRGMNFYLKAWLKHENIN